MESILALLFEAVGNPFWHYYFKLKEIHSGITISSCMESILALLFEAVGNPFGYYNFKQ